MKITENYHEIVNAIDKTDFHNKKSILDKEGLATCIQQELKKEGLIIVPIDIFYQAMHFKSDANPFDESGDCQVKDGYKFIEKSINDYLRSLY